MNSALAIFEAGLKAVDPYAAVMRALSLDGDILFVDAVQYELANYDSIIVVGAGKATARMALALENILGERISAGLIVVKYDHGQLLRSIGQVEAGHPLPDVAGVAATQRILAMVSAVDRRSLVIALLSGGASALLVAPASGITLQDKQQCTRLLLEAGANISELNTVRKHLSAIKGGRLAQAVYPASLLTLIVSDVIGDPLGVIASGPTAVDDSTYEDALAVLAHYDLQGSIPTSALRHLQAGRDKLVAETVKQDAPCWSKTHNVVIANLQLALQTALVKAEQLGYQSRIVSATLQGEARRVARDLAELAKAELLQMKAGERRCLLSGGETTVTVRGKGQGGRNQELALAFAIEVAGITGVCLLSVGTDGTDGPNDAAGARVDGATISRANALDAQQYLADNDSYHYFELADALSAGGSHLKTGATGTNVMDMQILLLQK
ncbi:MAG: glycerate kinase [Gallionella sp.]